MLFLSLVGAKLGISADLILRRHRLSAADENHKSESVFREVMRLQVHFYAFSLFTTFSVAESVCVPRSASGSDGDHSEGFELIRHNYS